MPDRVRLGPAADEGGSYFTAPNSALQFISSGCTVLDCALGGGWPLSRIVHVYGDSSTGKTGLAIEAAANFYRQYPNGLAFYRETEAAFDESYAETLGMPIDKVSFVDPSEFVTVEDFFKDLCEAAAECRLRKVPGLYMLDSLDGLSDAEEMKRKFDEGTYGTAKARQMSKLFRMCESEIAASNMCLMVITQARDNIGVVFGPKKTFSGGTALRFYASQRVCLQHLSQEERTRQGIKRVVGVNVRARVEKNKIAVPHRQCQFTILFGYGIDSVKASLDWLEEVGRESVLGETATAYRKRLSALPDDLYWQEVRTLDQKVRGVWTEVESLFLNDVRKKYGS